MTTALSPSMKKKKNKPTMEIVSKYIPLTRLKGSKCLERSIHSSKIPKFNIVVISSSDQTGTWGIQTQSRNLSKTSKQRIEESKLLLQSPLLVPVPPILERHCTLPKGTENTCSQKKSMCKRCRSFTPNHQWLETIKIPLSR